MRYTIKHANEPQHFEPQHYQLPDEAYHRLAQARDQLQLLARLTAGRSHHDDLPGNELQISAAPLSQCFQQLATELDSCLQAAFYPRRNPTGD